MPSDREPIFNIPAVIVVLVAVIGLIHVGLTYAVAPLEATRLLLLFAFIPARYGSGLLPDGWLPGGFGAEIWTFFSYAFLHADLTHVVFNLLWLVAFGTPVARRFGAVRFFVFFLVTAAAGAAVHLATHAGELQPVIGASASVSGAMAAAMRFMFQGGGPIGGLRPQGQAFREPAAPLRRVLRDPRVFAFLAVWFGINLLVGLFGIGIGGVDQAVAWEAHIGGFLAGLLLFPLFDPVRREPLPEAPDASSSRLDA